MGRVTRWTVVAAITTVATGFLAGTAGARPLPVVYSLAAATATAAVSPDSSPPGANDFSCRPTARQPEPVVLTHGTLFNMTIDWQALSPC